VITIQGTEPDPSHPPRAGDAFEGGMLHPSTMTNEGSQSLQGGKGTL
jgi:hypothetical protein